MPRELLYWTCQLAGWGGLVACSSLFRMLTNELSSRGFRADLSVSIAGLLVTHALRRLITSHAWLKLSSGPLAIRVLLGSCSVGLSLAIVAVTLSQYLRGVTHPASSHAFLWVFLIGSVLGLAWISLYLGVQFFERSLRQQTRAIESESAARQLEISLLESQMDPHFVYNSLNVIRALISEDPVSARAAVSHLSGLMRATTNATATPLISIERELQMVRDYLALQKFRFEERLQYVIECPERLKRLAIPPLTLQSLVENGVKHGICHREDGGSIEMTVRERGEQIWMRVKSSGAWLESDREGGLANLEKRLELIYRGSATLEIDSSGATACIVDVSVPNLQVEETREPEGVHA